MYFVSLQSKRGGKVILNKISFPTITEFKDAEKGDALTGKLEIMVFSLHFFFVFHTSKFSLVLTFVIVCVLAMELTLAMEKLVNEKLLHLHKVSVFSTPYIWNIYMPSVYVHLLWLDELV